MSNTNLSRRMSLNLVDIIRRRMLCRDLKIIFKGKFLVMKNIKINTTMPEAANQVLSIIRIPTGNLKW